MARMIDADAVLDRYYAEFEKQDICDGSQDREWLMQCIKETPTFTTPPASPDLISRSALLRGETEPEIITGSDSELAEHMEWDRWMDKIKRAPAVGKEEES